MLQEHDSTAAYTTVPRKQRRLAASFRRKTPSLWAVEGLTSYPKVPCFPRLYWTICWDPLSKIILFSPCLSREFVRKITIIFFNFTKKFPSFHMVKFFRKKPCVMLSSPLSPGLLFKIFTLALSPYFCHCEPVTDVTGSQSVPLSVGRHPCVPPPYLFPFFTFNSSLKKWRP